MGCGKSAVGVKVAARAGAPFHDLDLVVESECGMSISDFFQLRGEQAFRSLESRLLPTVLKEGGVVAVGGGAPLEERNWRLLTELAVTVFIDCEFDTIWGRTSGTNSRPLAVGRSREELRELLMLRLPRYREAIHIVNGDRPADLVAEEIVTLWSD